jgi:tRNA(Ile)-lysidine synthase
MLALLKKILGYADGFDMLPAEGVVLACVSGGIDSMCLLDVLLEISKSQGFSVAAAHFNHRLRGDESDRDEAFVSGYCAGRGVECRVERASERLRGGEDAARNARYAFFERCADELGAVRIATAHTADDNAETMLLNLARGTGTAGLSGIPPRRGRFIRPMLTVTRGEVVEYAEKQGIPYNEDSTNRLDIYSRNKLRHNVVPILKEINPNFCDAASVASKLLHADEEYISSVVDEYVNESCADGTADAQGLLSLPFAVSSRVIRKLYGGNLSYRHVRAVLGLCGNDGSQGSLSLPGKRVFVEYGRVSFGDGAEGRVSGEVGGGFEPVEVADGVFARIEGVNLEISCKMVTNNDIIHKSFNTFLFDYSSVCGKITVRPRKEGDSIRLLGAGGTKSLKKLFIERRIPMRERQLVPVVADDCGVLAVYGIGRGDRALPRAGEAAMMVEFVVGAT